MLAAAGTQAWSGRYSNIVLGAPLNFTTDATICASSDSPPCSEVTTVKAAHINQLWTAVNAVRSLAALSTVQTSVAAGDIIYKDDVQSLRDKLHEALAPLGIQETSYEDATLAGAPNGTPIKAVHIGQLRTRATKGSGAGNGDPKLQPVSATASRIHSTPYDASHAIDGNAGTLWSAGDFAPQWIQVDLGQLSNISTVRLLVDHRLGCVAHGPESARRSRGWFVSRPYARQ